MILQQISEHIYKLNRDLTNKIKKSETINYLCCEVSIFHIFVKT